MQRSRFVTLVFGGLFFCQVALASVAPSQVGKLEVDESTIYVYQPKKLQVRAEIIGSRPGSDQTKWNLVEVDAEGRFVRYIGIFFFNSRKSAYFRKLEIQQNEPGRRFFEAVSDAELEPFLVATRPRVVVEIVARPTLIQILEGVWRRVFGGATSSITRDVAGDSDSAPPARQCRDKIEGGWTAFSGESAISGALVQKGPLPAGGVFAAFRATVDFSAQSVIEQLWEPSQIKNMRTTRLKVVESSESAGVKVRTIDVNVRPFLFVNLDWKETWSLTERQPGELFRVEYRKTSGEKRLKHFCGWMEARKIGDSKTEVTLLEEVEAPHRSADDVANGHAGTIQMIQRRLKR